MKSLQDSSGLLSSYYRRLFVLPSTVRIVLYSLISAFILSFLIQSKFYTTLVLIITGALLSGAILTFLGKTSQISILSYRRAMGLVLVDLIIYTFSLIFALPSRYVGSLQHISNIFGYVTFVAIGFNLVVMRGVFCRNILHSLVFASVFPVMVYILLYKAGAIQLPSGSGLLLGILIFSISGAFLSYFVKKDSILGYSPIDILQAFIHAWVAGNGEKLEKVFSNNASNQEVETTIITFTTDRTLYVIVPGVHPGPLDPIGSYDLPELVFEELKDMGLAVTLHGTGSHERNIPTHRECKRYVLNIREQILSKKGEKAVGIVGPVKTSDGRYNATAWIMDKHTFVILSSAPYGSDDLDSKKFEEVIHKSRALGLDCTIVDAHNSLSPVRVTEININWDELLRRLDLEEEKEFLVGWANSNEIGFQPRDDLFEAGITLILFRIAGKDTALVCADSNNSQPEVRQEIISVLEKRGVELIEFCTSDTHKSAGRGLRTPKGYYSLGEKTSKDELSKLIERLLLLAKERVKECDCTILSVRNTYSMVGSKVLERLAQITTSGAKYARRYAIIASFIFILSILLLNLF